MVEGLSSVLAEWLSAARHEVEQGQLQAQRIVVPEVTRVIHLLHSSRRPRSKAEDGIMRVILKVAREVESGSGWTMLRR